MTDNIEKIVQKAECVTAADEYFKARTWLMDTTDNRRIFEAGFDRAYALLSKLRAPVADERAAFEAAEREINSRVDLSYEWRTEEYKTPWIMERWCTWRRAWKARAALASAPVAGEAQKPFAWARSLNGYVGADLFLASDIGDPTDGDWVDGVTWRPLYLADAAPQASEAVRDAAPASFDKKAQEVAHSVVFYGDIQNRVQQAAQLQCAVVEAMQWAARAALSAQPGKQKKENDS